MSSDLDPHGQPYNLRFNRSRRAERDLSEFLGLARGLLADGVVSEDEAKLVHHWVTSHEDAVEAWPLNRLAERVEKMYADGHIDEVERQDLAELLESVVGGKAELLLGEDLPTALPLDSPPPEIAWSGSTFVFTGKFAYGPRAECQRLTSALGARCESNVTKRTNYLVIGTFGSRDWVHTSFGRKILKAVDYRDAGVPLSIVEEQHWSGKLQ